MHIFISYAKADSHEFAHNIADKLLTIPNITVWWDESLEVGSSWAAEIEEEIDRADIVMVLLSPDVRRKEDSPGGTSFVIKEINYAQAQDKEIMPIMVEKTSLPVQIADLQYIDLTEDYEEGMIELLNTVRQQLHLSQIPLPISDEAKKFLFLSKKSNQVLLIITGLIIVGLIVAGLLLSRNTDTAKDDEPTIITSNREWSPEYASAEYEDYSVDVVLVPAGCFNIGSTEADLEYYESLGADSGYLQDELGGQDNEICFADSFWIDEYEVSLAQYANLQGETPPAINEDLPVVNISILEAAAFCEKRGGRLPTEAEWEYVARGPDELRYPWGNEVNTEWFNTSESANIDSYDGLAPVTAYENGESWVGALNMLGNVSEWTSTLWHENHPYSSVYEKPDNTSSFRVFRGGSYKVALGYVHTTVRASEYAPDEGAEDIGFRCVLDELQ